MARSRVDRLGRLGHGSRVQAQQPVNGRAPAEPGRVLAGSPGDRLRPFAPPKPPDTVVGFEGRVVQASQVGLTDYRFSPARITVTTGTKVTFRNTGGEPHNAASSDGGGFDTGLLAQGETATVTFNRHGTYSFTCTPHPSMIGQIIVTGPDIPSAPAIVVETAKSGQAQKQPADPAH